MKNKKPLDQLSLEELRKYRGKVFRTGQGTRPEVVLITYDGRKAILKDYNQSDPWFRRLVGPLLAFREARALRLLRGQQGIPQLIKTLGMHAVLMDYVEGVTTKELKQSGQVDPSVFDRIYKLVDEIHQRGVAHCDLRSGGNTIITDSGQPYFVDFVAYVARSRWNLPWRWVFNKFCIADEIAVARMKKRLLPDQLTEKEKQNLELDKNHPLGKLARMVGKTFTRMSRFFLTDKD
jgi:predicted Ser/Thr protein kinase